MINLMSKGHVIPVVAFINKYWKEEDVSLVRHFAMEVARLDDDLTKLDHFLKFFLAKKGVGNDKPAVYKRIRQLIPAINRKRIHKQHVQSRRAEKISQLNSAADEGFLSD